MNWLVKTLGSSLGRKLTMALSGLFLISFLAVHLSGNFLLFQSNGDAFNLYSHFMSTSPIVRVLEIGLVLGFAVHIFTAIVLTKKNSDARPIKYHSEENKGSSWFSRNMGLTGSIILLFLIIHLKNFYWEYHNGTVNLVTIDGVQYKDMFKITTDVLKNPLFLGIYILSFILLAFHLNHGFQSAFQSIGFNHPKYTPLIKGISTAIAIALPLGFAAVAIAVALK
jgi:succinate dehydrogenase / fumarate reductase cytochrome b subunit